MQMYGAGDTAATSQLWEVTTTPPRAIDQETAPVAGKKLEG